MHIVWLSQKGFKPLKIFPPLVYKMYTAQCFAEIDQVDFTAKGRFSYLQDSVNFVRITSNLDLRIQRLDNNVAKVYLVDAQSVQQNIPAWIQMSSLAGAPVARLEQSWFITWANSYMVTVKGQPFLTITNQRQQALAAAPGTASGLV